MPVLSVQHVTTYRYRRPVGFGEHRMMFRPRDCVDQRLVSWTVGITPEPAVLRSIPDAFGNIITLASFTRRSRELRVENRLVVDHAATLLDAARVAPYARSWPFTYDLDDMIDLARVMERHYPDPEHRVDAWARSLLPESRTGSTLDVLMAMTRAIKHDFTYCARYEEGVQDPARTLALQAGTCRDYAVPDDGSGAGARHGVALRHRLHLFARGGRSREPGRRRHARLGRGVRAGLRLGGFRPDQRHRRIARPDPGSPASASHCRRCRWLGPGPDFQPTASA